MHMCLLDSSLWVWTHVLEWVCENYHYIFGIVRKGTELCREYIIVRREVGWEWSPRKVPPCMKEAEKDWNQERNLETERWGDVKKKGEIKAINGIEK